MVRKYYLIMLLSLVTLLQAFPAPLRAFNLESTGITPASIPSGNSPVFRVTNADLDGDGALENLILASGRLSISSDGRILWQSPEEWQVLQAAFSDLNNDGKAEVTLLIWRPFRPWPVDQWLPFGGRIAAFQNQAGQSCHLILIGWNRGGFRELWAGSAMASPIKSFAIADLNGDHTQELVTLETRYADPITAPARKLKVWQWNGFGFTVVSSMDGKFTKLSLVQAKNGRILILVP